MNRSPPDTAPIRAPGTGACFICNSIVCTLYLLCFQPFDRELQRLKVFWVSGTWVWVPVSVLDMLLYVRHIFDASFCERCICVWVLCFACLRLSFGRGRSLKRPGLLVATVQRRVRPCNCKPSQDSNPFWNSILLGAVQLQALLFRTLLVRKGGKGSNLLRRARLDLAVSFDMEKHQGRRLQTKQS